MQTRICKVSGENFTISDQEERYCHTHNIPLPEISPIERMRQMYSFSNAVFLYNTQCALTKKNILTCIPPDKGFTIYDIDTWQSDTWEPMSYGRDIDWSRPLLDQIAELQKAVPAPNLIIDKASIENSDYCNGVGYVRNCYLLIIGSEDQDCMFSSGLVRCKNVIDTVWGTDCELCYDSYHITNCYNVRHAEQSSNCSDSAFIYNCRGLKHCFGCVNLRSKEYCFFNEQLTKEEYEAKMNQIDLGSYQTVEVQKKRFQEFRKNFPIKYLMGNQNENSTGDELNSTRNCQHCFFVNTSEDIENGVQLNKAKDCIDFTGFGNNAELIYRCMSCGQNAYNLKFCLHTWNNVRDLEYCIYLSGSSDCFACIGLKKKQYCILNKQYSKEEYFTLVEKLREHMRKNNEYGKFFPTSMSYCHYNESEGMTYCPMTETEAVARGCTWAPEKVDPTSVTAELPDNIKDATDSLLTNTYICSKTSKRYRLIKQELTAYRNLQVPIPRVAPLERIKEKLYQNQIKPLLSIQCSNCHKSLVSVHDPKNQPVLCQECFEQVHN